MKRTFSILFFVVLYQLCLATNNSKLPEEPWRTIVEMTKYQPNTRWEDDISVKLKGNFSQQDSSMVEAAIKRLNELTETIKLQMTSDDWGNLEIFFIDSTNCFKYKSFSNIRPKDKSTSTVCFKRSKQDSLRIIDNLQLFFQLPVVPDSSRQHFITNKMALALFPLYWSNRDYFKGVNYIGPISIFMEATPIDMFPLYSELNRFDREIIKAIYSKNFSTLIPLAKKQFVKYEYPEWLRKYPHEILVFPFVFILFLLLGLFILIYKKLFVRIKNKLLQFNVISVISLFFLGLIITFYLTTALTLKYPNSTHFNLHNFKAGIFVVLILGLPAANLIRLIEIVINRTTQHRYFKVLLLFVSTSLIPIVTVFSIGYLSNEHLKKESIRIFSIVFMVFILIGIFRALISFFILKEKETKIENEIQLANLRELKSKAELNALHSKINPHFLYNSLNSIAGLAKTDAEKTEHMALSLSKLFRYSINKEQSDWSTFAEEMEMVRIYLDIEKVRFDDRLEFTIGLPDELKSVKVPRFIIQPLVENAIKHGISKLITKGEITALVHRKDNWIEIVVADNGPDFPAELNPGFGLQSIYDKLEIMYPNSFEMHFLNTPDKHILIKLA